MGELRAHWRANGPPAHIALAVIAAALGAKLTEERDAPDDARITGPTIAEMAAMAQPIGGDTMGATIHILAKLRERAA